jgi:hypothetical protein
LQRFPKSVCLLRSGLGARTVYEIFWGESILNISLDVFPESYQNAKSFAVAGVWHFVLLLVPGKYC